MATVKIEPEPPASTDEQPRPNTAVQGVRAVFDTNTHLHFPRFDSHNWADELGGGPMTVVVPLLVLEELDAHKNKGALVLGDRAAAVCRAITQAVEPSDRDAVGETRVELLLDPPDHGRRSNNDDEIMDRAQALTATPGAPVVVVTDDDSMRARARARGLAVHRPQTTRLPSIDPETMRLRKEVDEARKYQAARPDIKVRFADGSAVLTAPPPRTTSDSRDEWIQSLRHEAERRTPRALHAREDASRWGGSSMLRPQPWSIDRFNDEREEHLRAIEQWAGREYDRQLLESKAVELALTVVNAGGSAARDVEVRIEVLKSRGRLFQQTLREAEDPPDPPEPPSVLSPPMRPADMTVNADPTLTPCCRWKFDPPRSGCCYLVRAGAAGGGVVVRCARVR
jgi:hypothetical protein